LYRDPTEILQSNEVLEETARYALLPENALPFVVHLLAHLERFVTEHPYYKDTSSYLSFFLQELLHGADNFTFLLEMLQFIKQTEDVQTPDSKNIHLVSELALLIVHQRMDRKSFTPKHPGMVYLPPSLYQLPETLISPSQTYLPAGFQLLKKDRVDELLKEGPQKHIMEEGVVSTILNSEMGIENEESIEKKKRRLRVVLGGGVIVKKGREYLIRK